MEDTYIIYASNEWCITIHAYLPKGKWYMMLFVGSKNRQPHTCEVLLILCFSLSLLFCFSCNNRTSTHTHVCLCTTLFFFRGQNYFDMDVKLYYFIVGWYLILMFLRRQFFLDDEGFIVAKIYQYDSEWMTSIYDDEFLFNVSCWCGC